MCVCVYALGSWTMLICRRRAHICIYSGLYVFDGIETFLVIPNKIILQCVTRRERTRQFWHR